MVATSALSWLIVAGAAGARAHPEALYGMLGPLAVAAVSSIVTERTVRSRPERLMGVMITGLAIKAVLFGVYVTVMLRLMALRPVPFVASFTGYFIALHVIEAVFMQRLIADTIKL
jgi:hypothetical protein